MFAYSIIYRVFPKDRIEIVSRILPIRVDKLQDLDFWKPTGGLPTYIAVYVRYISYIGENFKEESNLDFPPFCVENESEKVMDIFEERDFLTNLGKEREMPEDLEKYLSWLNGYMKNPLEEKDIDVVIH
jgi:hypothetical protein